MTERLVEAPAVLVPSIVVGELLAGFRLGSREADNTRVLSDFLREDFVSLVPVDEEVALAYGEIFAELRAARTPIPMNDVWISAVARTCRASILTFDTDFLRVPGAEVILCAP